MKLIAAVGITLLGLASSGTASESKFALGGYLDNTFKYDQTVGSKSTFDAFHFNPIFLYQLEDNILASAELEFEHGGDEQILEYAQIDYLWNDYITITAGKFLVPFGAFNRRLHPTWISKVPGRPYSNNHVVPTGWAETGLMFSGAVGFGTNGGRVNYAAYVSNGLEGASGDDLRDLRKEFDARDKKNNNKAIGGRLGVVPSAGIEVGISGYTSKYDQAASPVLDINMYGFDAEYHREDYFELRGEYNQVDQRVFIATNNYPFRIKKGYYVQAALRLSVTDNDLLMPVEIALRYSAQNFPGEASDVSEVTPTLNYYLSSTTILRMAYTINGETGTSVDNNLFTLMLTKGL